jgi:hypothetical protein
MEDHETKTENVISLGHGKNYKNRGISFAMMNLTFILEVPGSNPRTGTGLFCGVQLSKAPKLGHRDT